MANRDSDSVIKLLEGKKNELLVTRHDQFSKPINLLNLYGEQECRNNNDKVEDNWNEIIEILTMIGAEGKVL